MEHQPTHNLKLVVSNPTQVASGLAREHVFGISGGSIGSAGSDTWQLSSHRTGAVGGHAEVRFMDGVFCLIDRSGRTYINSGTQPVGRGRRARLKSGDTITIGRYQLKAEVLSGQRQDGNLPEEAEDATLVNVDEGELMRAEERELETVGDEPLQGLQPAPGETFSDDPLQAWSAPRGESQHADVAESRDRESLLADKPEWYASEGAVTDEYRENRDVAMGLPMRKGEGDRMSETTKPARRRETSDQSRQHISGAPLLRGMDTDLGFADSDEMRLFLEEAGQTLKATVEGLLALHQGEDSRHQALRTRLQPIEDNPLRLGEDYNETVQTLFASQRSPVHLSAPAAVSESLQSLHHHQLATQTAIREGLDAILHAFSPEALLRRFHGYRRGLKTDEDESNWAWEMYQHYYRELSSSRQQGFERLFQEVFEQAYDQQLRQLQRENLS
ncbi:type VI secretion system-associated FHA domain protein TagH [Marinobacter salarius]|jgi:type VI secretion system protein ImpI|uniref:type VI secretion system-associated FHA domain protein TagH n=1 Tax=Marinobacter TaxID=2742 RepID=UPI001BCBDE9F|nr:MULTISPECIES: type VI secretion system-associated FHA domain protein TagH [Marinobacter]MBS8230723.1 type VI secretion system-associated FHA domain protein TagH [Marinobacter salarius]